MMSFLFRFLLCLSVFLPLPLHCNEDPVDALDIPHILSPMPGRIVKICVKPGDVVKKGDELLLIEAMKMEMAMRASHDGYVRAIECQAGDIVQDKMLLMRFSANPILQAIVLPEPEALPIVNILEPLIEPVVVPVIAPVIVDVPAVERLVAENAREEIQHALDVAVIEPEVIKVDNLMIEEVKERVILAPVPHAKLIMHDFFDEVDEVIPVADQESPQQEQIPLVGVGPSDPTPPNQKVDRRDHFLVVPMTPPAEVIVDDRAVESLIEENTVIALEDEREVVPNVLEIAPSANENIAALKSIHEKIKENVTLAPTLPNQKVQGRDRLFASSKNPASMLLDRTIQALPLAAFVKTHDHTSFEEAFEKVSASTVLHDILPNILLIGRRIEIGAFRFLHDVKHVFHVIQALSIDAVDQWVKKDNMPQVMIDKGLVTTRIPQTHQDWQRFFENLAGFALVLLSGFVLMGMITPVSRQDVSLETL